MSEAFIIAAVRTAGARKSGRLTREGIGAVKLLQEGGRHTQPPRVRFVMAPRRFG